MTRRIRETVNQFGLALVYKTKLFNDMVEKLMRGDSIVLGYCSQTSVLTIGLCKVCTFIAVMRPLQSDWFCARSCSRKCAESLQTLSLHAGDIEGLHGLREQVTRDKSATH